jgi:hypothetical protein
MNPETWISFNVGDYPACTQTGHLYTVSMQIYNTIMQPVSVPVSQSSGSVAGGKPITNLKLPCGQYTAYWNGKFQGTQREASSGVYPYVLVIDGHRFAAKMTVAK